MTDEPENIMLVYLRRLDAKTDRVLLDMQDMKHRMTAIEIQVSQVSSTAASHYASLALRLDRLEGRLERLERHADIIPA